MANSCLPGPPQVLCLILFLNDAISFQLDVAVEIWNLIVSGYDYLYIYVLEVKVICHRLRRFN